MIQDILNNNSNSYNLKNKCYACNLNGHSVQKCNKIHFCPDREKIIKKTEFSFPQQRNPFKRKKEKKIRAGLFKKIKIEINEPLDSYDEKSSISNDYSSESNHQDNSEFTEKEMEPSENFFSNQQSSKNLLANKNIKNRPSLTLNIQPEPRISINSESLPQKSESELFGDKEKMDNSMKKNIPGNLEKEIDYESPIIYELRDFDKIQNYKKYFPDMNFNKIEKSFNETNSQNHKNNKKKLNYLKRYSMYTFNINSMYTLINRRRKQRSGQSSPKVSSKKSHADRFLNIIKKIMEIIKKKKETKKKKWYNSVGRLFKKKKKIDS